MSGFLPLWRPIVHRIVTEDSSSPPISQTAPSLLRGPADNPWQRHPTARFSKCATAIPPDREGAIPRPLPATSLSPRPRAEREKTSIELGCGSGPKTLAIRVSRQPTLSRYFVGRFPQHLEPVQGHRTGHTKSSRQFHRIAAATEGELKRASALLVTADAGHLARRYRGSRGHPADEGGVEAGRG